jgi:Putative beta-barrel porin-2, OmpL-like. bbp2
VITVASSTTKRVRVRGTALGLFLAALATEPAVAQESQAFRRLDFTIGSAAASAIDAAPSGASAVDSQPASQSPDSAAMSFFSKTEFTGFVDMYYAYNFNKPGQGCATVGGVAIFNCLRNFDVAHNAFSLNLAEFAIEKKPAADSRGGFRLDLNYGATAAMVHSAEPGGLAIYQNVQQAYLSYLAPVGSGLQIDIGKFVTHNGAEVIETKDNWNYSRSLLFSWAIPYYHTGIRATYAVNDKVSLMGDIMNGWNNAVDNNTGKTAGAGVTYKPIASTAIVLNYTGGPEQTNDNDDWRHLFDTTVTFSPTSKLSLMANYDYGSDKVAGDTVSWQGIAAYVKVQPTAWFAFIPRAEYYDDKSGFTTGTVQQLKEITLTGEFKHRDGVMMRIEYRRDSSDAPFFLKNSMEQVENQDTFTIGFVYAFSSRNP